MWYRCTFHELDSGARFYFDRKNEPEPGNEYIAIWIDGRMMAALIFLGDPVTHLPLGVARDVFHSTPVKYWDNPK